MSKTAAVEARSNRLAAQGAVAVIGDVEVRPGIFEVLEQDALGSAAFDDVAMLCAQRQARTPALIVLCVEDSATGLTGFIEPLAQSFPEAPVIVVCSRIERWAVREALMAGAAGVVLWESVALALAPSMRAALAGQTCVPRGHWRQVEPPALSSREKQILGLVVMGFTNGQIAQQLFLAESTVKSHLSSAFGKLGVRSRNEAVHLILDPERGLGMGILALGGEPMESPGATQ
jgi:DNA-binding NarL/FixJ family response regulator